MCSRDWLYLGQRLERVGSAGKQAFDVSLLQNYAAGFSGPAAAAGLFLSLLGRIRSEQSKIAQAQMTDAESRGQLVQLAGGDTNKRDRLFAMSDITYNEGFVRDRIQANRLTFELDSAGLSKDRAFFSQLQLIDDSATLAKSTGLIQSGFSGGDSTGGSRAIVSKSIAGALPATGVSPAQIAEGVAIASASAKKFGLTDEETFAAVSRIAQTTGSGSEAGTKFNAMLSSLSRQGLADELGGRGLEAIVGNVSDRGLTKEGLTKFLGSSEAAQGFDVLTNRDALRARIGEIKNAQATNLAGQTIGNAIQDRALASTVLRRRGAAGRELMQQEDAIAENLAAADRDAAYMYELRQGNRTRAAMNEWTGEKVDYWLGPSGGEEALQQLVEETRRQTDVMESNSSQTTTRQE
ncbi:phage tail tape measure protein [Aeoliella sp. ICT_H6.2]|uniref:Phage tail tape measure protein n=1 Tax=Aeoliella straminimaris TaxID=2954799 RepID=A0A9X2FA23_9BACT|nr:phage tail tape measure protein [Aeoliella straminimaris]